MLDVVAGVIRNDENKVLIAQRGLHKDHGGMWEFAGGRVEDGETFEDAIIREMKEELEIDVTPIKRLGSHQYEYPHLSINLMAVECEYTGGELVQTEHEAIAWVTPEEMKNYIFTPADEFIVEKLQEI